MRETLRFRRATPRFSASNTPVSGVKHTGFVPETLRFRRATPRFSASNTPVSGVKHTGFVHETLRFRRAIYLANADL
jgi:hypothetical protein